MDDAGSVHHVVIFAFDGVQSLDVAGPAEVLAGASQLLSGGRGYDVTITSPRGGIVTTESAIALDTVPMVALLGRPIDTVIVPGGRGTQDAIDDPSTVTAIGALIERADRLVTICSGALLAAATGALDGHRVTTHWARAAELAQRWPAVDVDPDPIYLCSQRPGERDVWTSAGVTAGIDLTLALVEHDHSTDVAQTIARWMVMFLRRPGGQSQFAAPTWIRQAPPGPVQRAQAIIIDDPGADHRVGELARRVGMSERHFVRTFARDVGLSPARFVARVRVDVARQALEASSDTVDAIARTCGFGTAETMRRTLQRQLGVSPDAYRQRFRTQPGSSGTGPGEQGPGEQGSATIHPTTTIRRRRS
jgi:transcriptional regulator GlxA family with amidase domain